MKRIAMVLALVLWTGLYAQQQYYPVTAGNGYGLRFWNSDNYKIHMGNTSEYQYGPVTDYSIKMNMNSDTSRGWTWGIDGLVPIAGLNTQGNFQIAGYFNATNYIAVSRNGSYRVAMNGQGNGYITGRNDAIEQKFLIHTNGSSYLNGGNVGIGTTQPSETFHLVGNSLYDAGNGSSIKINGYHGIETEGDAHWLHLNRYSNDHVSIGHNSTSDVYMTHGGGRVGIGTTNPDAKLTVKGNIHAQEVKVDLNGAVAPDYVFKEDYNLRSLQEVQDYIKEHGHLPNIPSAQEMEANGIDLGQMNLRLLEKIEELTLYTLKQEEEIQELKTQNSKMAKLEKENKKIIVLEDRLSKIEELLN
ncbi:hypothetical protein FGF1_14790 [Flavobacteriaceae bacterium GF1]